MTIRDRGSKKWTSLMLTEHVKQLRDYFEDEYYRVEKPVLDEQELEEINEKIYEAMEYTKPVLFTYYRNGHIQEIKGFIHRVDVNSRTIYLVEESETTTKLKTEDIVSVNLIS